MNPFPSDDEWEDSPYAQYVGVGMDDEDEHAFAYTPMGDGSDDELVPWETVKAERDGLTWRLSYWFWLNVYRIQRRLGLMR